MNISNLIKKHAENQPHKKAVICGDDGREYTWLELDKIVNKVANAISNIGIKKGDVVATYLHNSPEFLFIFFGVTRLGAVILPFNILFRSDEVSYILNNSRAKLIFGASHEIEKYLLNIREQFPYLENVIVVGDHLPGCLNFHSLIADAPDTMEPVDCCPEDLSSLVYTSGTSGKPKGAMLSHSNLEAIGNLSSIALHINDLDLLMTGAPFCHICFVLSVLGPFSVGAGAVTMRHFRPDTTLQYIERYRVTHFTGVPTMYIYMLHHFDSACHNYDLSSWRMAHCAGAAMPVEYLESIVQKFGVGYCELYGATETSSIVSYNRLGHGRSGSIGQPAYGVQVRIVSETGQDLPTGQIGEIIVKGPGILKGYWEMPEATREAFYGDWFRTGDLGYFDADGYIFIVDRLKDVIISGGYNVYPREIEEIIYKHPKVREAAVIGIKDSLKGEVPKAFISLKDNEQMSQEELINFCSQRMASYKVPRSIEFIPDLPKNVIGKIQKRSLKTVDQ